MNLAVTEYPEILKPDKLYKLNLLSFKKDKVMLEFSGYSVLYTESLLYFYNLQESRFWLYQDVSNSTIYKFCICFKGSDRLNGGGGVDMFRKKHLGEVSFIYSINSRNLLLQSFKDFLLLKARVLGFSKGGYVLMCFGLNSLFKAFPDYNFFGKKFSYSSWFILNIPFFGVLNSFVVKDWKLYCFEFGKRVKSYRNLYFRKKNIQSKFILAKN